MIWLEETLEEKEQIRKYYNIDENKVKGYIELIKIWKTKQPHLPDNLTDDFIEKILLKNKFQLEQTKQKLDNYYSLRGQDQDLIQDLEKIVPSEKATIFLPMPKLTAGFERIVIMKLINFDPDLHDAAKFVQLDLAVTELLLQYDYSIGTRFLIDFSGFTLKHLIKWNLMLIAKHVTLIEQAYSCRILGIELVNIPTFGDRILALMKIILSPKIYERLTTHPIVNSIYKVIPKDCLPSEYGGLCSNIPDLLTKWDQMMESHQDLFLRNCRNVSKEYLRPSHSVKSDAFGTDGTFKKLAID